MPMLLSELLSILPQAAATVEDVVKLYNAVQSGLPIALDAWKKFEAVIAAGGEVTPAEWTQLLSDLDAAQAGLDGAINQAEGVTSAGSAGTGA